MRIISKILAGTMILGVFLTGCSNEKGVENKLEDPIKQSDGIKEENKESEITQEDDVINEEVPILPDIELSNKDITYFGLGAIESDSALAELYRENYGGEITSIQTTYGEYYTDLASLIAAGTPPDVIGYFSDSWYPNMIINDLAVPTDDLVDWDSVLWKDMKDANEQRKWIDGKMYALTTSEIPLRMVYYNIEMFENAGMETPGDYYERGEWTVDKMVELAENMVVKDSDGNVTQEGLTILGQAPAFILPAYNQTAIKFEDGKFVNNLKHESITEMMNILAGLKDKKAVSFNYGNFKDQKTAMLVFHEEGPRSDFLELTERGAVGVVPFPKVGEDGTHNVVMRGDGYCIAPGAKNPEGGLALINCARYMQTDYFKSTDPETVEFNNNISEEVKSVSNQIKEIVDDCVKIPDVMHRAIVEDSVIGMGSIINEGEQWSSVVEKVYPDIQKRVDELNKAIGQ